MTRRIKYFIASSSTCLVFVLLFGAMRGKSASPEDTYRHLAVYTEVLSRIKTDYVEEPNMKSVTLGALNGLLESIDPYASYLNADQYKQWLKSRDEHKAAVGLVLSKRFGYIGIIDSIPGSPAAKAGLTTTDVLESINGVSTRDMPLAFAQLLLEGDPGSTVTLGVLRLRKPDPQKLTLTRAMIDYPDVTGKMLPDQVGLIQVASLEGDRPQEVAAKVEDLQKQGAKDLILDLRHCATGGPEQGEQVANIFLDKGLITYSEGQKVERHDVNANPANDRTHLPLAVVVDRGTANGAEIAAAALLDDKRAEVVGERTYGDASVRKPITMDDGSAVILSVAKFYSPSGKAIQDTGVTPSVPVQEPEPISVDDDGNPQTVQPQQQPQTAGEDILLQKAVQVVTKGKAAVTTSNTGAANSQGATPGTVLTPLNIPEPAKK